MIPFSPTLLALDIGSLVSFVVIILAILGWLGNLVGAKQQPPIAAGGPPRQPPRPRDKRLQNEIDLFLQEVTGKKKPAEEVPIEIIPEEPRRPRPVRPQQSKPRRPPQPPPQPQPVEGYLAESHLSASGDIRRLAEDKETAASAERQDTHPVRKIVSQLRDPAGVQRAIILNEILSPPKALRGRK